MKNACLLAAFCLFALAVTGKADITYNVNRTIGAGTVTGTITTDGATGVLATGDIVTWNLTLFDGTLTFSLTGPAVANSVVQVAGSDLTATASTLSFNFSGGDGGYLLFQDGLFSGQHYYCDQATPSGPCYVGESVVPGAYNDGSHQVVAQPDSPIIGTTGTLRTVTPEPTAEILIPSMLLGVAFFTRRRIPRQGPR